jgi:hypothetical protein
MRLSGSVKFFWAFASGSVEHSGARGPTPPRAASDRPAAGDRAGAHPPQAARAAPSYGVAGNRRAFVKRAADPPHSADTIFRVTLLGSGTPDPSPDRFGPSTLIEAGDQKLLIDVGRGATIRLFQLHIPLSKIDIVFFTHYHSDYTVGMPDLLFTGWLPPAFGHRTQPLHVVCRHVCGGRCCGVSGRAIRSAGSSDCPLPNAAIKGVALC